MKFRTGALAMLAALLFVAGATEVSAQDDNGSMEMEPEPVVDDKIDFMPVVVLAVISVLVFLIAKYGP